VGGCDFVLCARLRSGPCVPTMLVDVGKCYSLIITLKHGGPHPNMLSWSFIVEMRE
jgi:hypothetical protein